MDLVRREFGVGWAPDCDAINAPPDALLRMDNLTLDELGVLSLRQGSSQVNVGFPLSELDVHSLFTIFRAGTRIRYAGAGASVFRQAVTPLGVTMGGTGDTSFGSHLGQVLFARGNTKYKDDGTTVRNWGIAMTGAAPVVDGPVVSDSKEFASWDAAETATHTLHEDNAIGLAYGDDRLATPNGAVSLYPEVGSGRLRISRALPGPTDFSLLDGGREATDDDIIKFWMYVSNPSVVEKVTLQVDFNGGGFISDYVIKEWPGAGSSGADGTVANPGVPGGTNPGPGENGPGEPPLI